MTKQSEGYGGRVLSEDRFRDGSLLYIKNPRKDPNGAIIENDPLGHNILIYYMTPSSKKVVGYAFFDMYPDYCTISGIGIKEKSFKRNGIGTKVLSLIEEDCAKCGVGMVFIPGANYEGRKHLLSNNYTEINGRFFKEIPAPMQRSNTKPSSQI